MGVTNANIALTLRSVKGIALTHTELDTNQANLKTAVEQHSHDDFAALLHNHDTAYASAAELDSLAEVARSGSYNDLSDKPIVPGIDADLSSVSDDDDTVPSAKATKAALDTKLAAANGAATNPVITNYTETVYAPAAGTTFTVDLANGTKQRFTTTGNATITLPAAVTGKSYMVEIVYGGAHTVTWAGGTAIAWAGGTAPTATAVAGKRDKYVFDCTSTSRTDGADAGRNY